MIYGLSVESILTAALIFIRISAVTFALPFIGDQPTPVRVRILLSVALTFALQGLVPGNWMGQFPADIFAFIFLVVKEICIGLFLGYVARLLFDGIIMAASLVGYQMGFGTADLFMPDVDGQMNAFTALHRIIMVSIFFILNLHYMYIDAIVRTFTLIPAGGIVLHADLAGFLVQLTSELFKITLQLSAPILIALLFCNTALGLLARTVPQLNIFTMSFPVGFFVGLGVYLATLPFFPGWVSDSFNLSQENILKTIQGMAP